MGWRIQQGGLDYPRLGLQVAAVAPAWGTDAPSPSQRLHKPQAVLCCCPCGILCSCIPSPTYASAGTCVCMWHKGFCLLLPSSLWVPCAGHPLAEPCHKGIWATCAGESEEESGWTCAVGAEWGSPVSSGLSNSQSPLQVSIVPLSYTQQNMQRILCVCCWGSSLRPCLCQTRALALCSTPDAGRLGCNAGPVPRPANRGDRRTQTGSSLIHHCIPSTCHSVVQIVDTQ